MGAIHRISASVSISTWIVFALWLILVLYWAVSAVGVKRGIGAGIKWREIALRLVAFAVVIAALRIPGFKRAVRSMQVHAAHSALASVVGVAFCALGVGLAIFARAHLGRNWGMPMSRKEKPELVTTGPYSVVRHPIYGGILIAMFGSTIGASAVWALPLVLFAVYFGYSARREEGLMMRQFPDRYPAYSKRTKMILPFLL